MNGAVFVGRGHALVALTELGQIGIVSTNGSVVRTSLPMLNGGMTMVASQLSLGGRGVIAYDRGRRAMTTLLVDRNGGLQIATPKELPLPRTVTGLISCANYLFAYAPDSGGVLYRLSTIGVLEMSIHLDPEVFRTALEDWMDKAELVCDRDRAQVILANSMRSRLRAFDFRGRLRWRAEVAGFQVIDFQMTGPSSSRTRVPPDGYHELVSAGVDREGLLVLQYGLITKESVGDGRRYARVESWTFSAADGNRRARPRDLPWIIVAAPDRQLVRTDGGLTIFVAPARTSSASEKPDER